jgi:hypothetical protein
VETRTTALRNALELRKNQPLTPYKVDSWTLLLHQYNLLAKYPNFPNSLCHGFDAGIRNFSNTTPVMVLPYIITQKLTSKSSTRIVGVAGTLAPCSAMKLNP